MKLIRAAFIHSKILHERKPWVIYQIGTVILSFYGVIFLKIEAILLAKFIILNEKVIT